VISSAARYRAANDVTVQRRATARRMMYQFSGALPRGE